MNDYVIGYDKGIKKDRSSLIISKYNNSNLYVLAEFYDEKADLLNEIITTLQQENKQLKKMKKMMEEKLKAVEQMKNDDKVLEYIAILMQEKEDYKKALLDIKEYVNDVILDRTYTNVITEMINKALGDKEND